MRTKILIIGVVAFFSFTFAKAQRGARIAYIDMEYILESVPEYQEASKQLEQKMQRWKGEIDQMSNEISQMKASLQNEKVLLTKELIEEKEEDISLREQDLADYQQKRFGPQGDFLLQRQQLIQPIQDQVFNEVQKIGKQKKYDMLIDSSEAALLYSADRHDVSDLVLKAIGRTGKRKEAQEKQDARNNPVQDDEPYLSVVEAEEKEKKEQAKEDKKEAVQKAISERDAIRNEQRRVRDSAKAAKAAAYKARRDKLMADRKRRKDSVLAVRAEAKAKKQAEIDARNAEKNKNTPPGGE
ncbi:OmpH family outer membrane protein [Nonlabens sp.]|uniref:OmpH family outer membrane protein n=1 Tax=Nonlabens sp. TaxID=1888209 RepID=UPI003264C22D